MKGDRTNYAKSADGIKITLRLYGYRKRYIQRLVYESGQSPADWIQSIIDDHIEGYGTYEDIKDKLNKDD